MLLLEYWKDIPGLKRYQASYSGSLRHLGKVIERGRYRFNWQPAQMLRPFYEKNAYAGINLSIDGVWNYKKVHVLVALAFIPNPNGLPEVNHLNLDKWDNRVCNLEWVTRKQNMDHAAKNGRGGGRKKNPPTQLSIEGQPMKNLNCEKS